MHIKPLSAIGCRRSATTRINGNSRSLDVHKTAVGTKSRYRRSAVGVRLQPNQTATADPSLRFGNDKSTLITPFFAAKAPLKGRIRHIKVRILALISS
jgi:hypothetical protein